MDDRAAVERAASGSAELALLRRWLDAVCAGLDRSRDEIDALNVYPVPDGDTGTNLSLTLDACRDAWPDAATALAEVLAALERGALLGSRGNSGVIASQLLRAGCAVAAAGEWDAARLREAFAAAAEAAYAAVETPVEGTMLTVARAASDGAAAAAPDAPVTVLRSALEAARDALAATPLQLPVLRRAGVVDAGGRGLVVALEWLLADAEGVEPPVAVAPVDRQRVAAAAAVDPADGPAYEVMYLLEAESVRVPVLRSRLGELGNSVLVVGGPSLWNVHAHVDDPAAAIEAGLEAGRPYRLVITRFGDLRPARSTGLVAMSAGPGMTVLLETVGAVVVEALPGVRPSAGELLAAIRASAAPAVTLLPHHRDLLPAAAVAAREAETFGQRVAVVPTTAAVQVLSAAAVHDPDAAHDADVVAMTAAARGTRHGGVTVATREALTMAGICRPGDVLGLLGGDIAIIGSDLEATAIEVVDRLVRAGGELVTLLVGAEAPPGLVDAVAAHVARTYDAVDVVVHEGGQPLYPLLVGVE